MKKAKPALILLLKILVSGGLLAFFFTRTHPERFFSTLLAADFSYIALAMVVYLATQAVSAARWQVLARPLGFEQPFGRYLVFYLIGMFFNLFAPGTVGGDVSRVYYLAQSGMKQDETIPGGPTVRGTVSVLVDRIVGMAVLVWVGATGLLLFPEYQVPTTVKLITFALAAGFILAGVMVPLLRRLLPEDGHPLAVKLRVALRSYRAHGRALPNAVAISVIVHLIQAWVHWILGNALSIDIPLSYCFILYPLVGTFSAIPISLNGLGLREGGYIFMFAVIGLGTEKGIVFGLLLFFVVVANSLIGGLVFLLHKSPRPSAVPDQIR
ncbi:MAG: flippase-like domain-containing protein [Deltaproteobacteria bacterium]|nr:flippase-like domain-containing protein [Deltaproteobacteria bacterium]